MKTIKILGLFSLLLLSGCAIIHHTQVGEVDSKTVLKGQKFEIRVSETGVSFKEAAQIGKSLTNHQGTSDDIGQAQKILSMFQMGPSTGNHVFSDDYADLIFDKIKQKCPNGKISGLTSIRETAKYPVVSGEIVRILGYCLKIKGS